jgi:hypothetical protein
VTPLALVVLGWMVQLQDPNALALRGIMTPKWAASYPQKAQEIADAAEKDPIGKSSRYTAALLTWTAYQESRFDDRPCERQKRYDCDGGASVGMFQTWKGWGLPTAETSLRLMHKSFEICEKRPFDERLAWYAAGGAGCDRRLELSRSRMHAAARLAKE